MKPSIALDGKRDVIRRLSEKHGLGNPRIFGSVLTESDREGSDLDILVDASPQTTLFDLGGLQADLEALLGVRVDVVTPRDLPAKLRQRVLDEARQV